MRKGIITIILAALISASCEKAQVTPTCGCEGTKTEVVDNIFGLVVDTADGFEILTDEKGLLLPCNELPSNLKIDSQPVTISGQLKVPCKKIVGEFSITPVTISTISPSNALYNKTDIVLTVIKSEDYGYASGYGFKLEDKRSTHGTTLLAPFPISGNSPLNTPDKAIKSGLIYVFMYRQGASFVTPEILKYVKVID